MCLKGQLRSSPGNVINYPTKRFVDPNMLSFFKTKRNDGTWVGYQDGKSFVDFWMVDPRGQILRNQCVSRQSMEAKYGNLMSTNPDSALGLESKVWAATWGVDLQKIGPLYRKVYCDPSLGMASPAPPANQNGPPSEATQRLFRELAKKRSKTAATNPYQTAGVVFEYFQQHPEIDVDLLPIDELGAIVLALYPPDLLDLIEKEGYLVNLYGNDMRAAFGLSAREGKISQVVLGALREYKRTGILPEKRNIHASETTRVRERLASVLKAPFEPTLRTEGTPHWHKVLGVTATATMEEIRAAYRRKIAEYHPDKVAGLGAELVAVAEKKSKEINVAYTEAQKARGP